MLAAILNTFGSLAYPCAAASVIRQNHGSMMQQTFAKRKPKDFKARRLLQMF
jgi:hypothetical protein